MIAGMAGIKLTGRIMDSIPIRSLNMTTRGNNARLRNIMYRMTSVRKGQRRRNRDRQRAGRSGLINTKS